MLVIKEKWKLILKPEIAVFFGMDALLEDTVEQVTHKIQDKGGIKRCNVSLYMIDSLCNCGKTVNQLLLEDISAEIEIEYRPSEKNDELLDNNDVSCHI